MSELWDKIMVAKLEQRKKLALLPIEKKLEIMEMLRDRALSIKQSRPLKQKNQL